MKKIFMRGLIAITPIILTISIAIWLFTVLENAFRPPLEHLISTTYYFPGLGILISLLFIFCVGVIINTWLIQKIYGLGEAILKKIPLVKSLYEAIRDVMNFFEMGQQQKGDHIVMIELLGLSFIGIVTRDSFDDLPDGIGTDTDIAVYLPLSYQIGGFTVIVPHSSVRKVDMGVEQGLRFAVTAGAPAHHRQAEK